MMERPTMIIDCQWTFDQYKGTGWQPHAQLGDGLCRGHPGRAVSKASCLRIAGETPTTRTIPKAFGLEAATGFLTPIA